MSIFGNVVTSDPNYDVGSEAPATLTQQGRLRIDGGPGSGGSLSSGNNRSGTIGTGGAAQQMAPANASRIALKGQNISAADLWINEIGGTATVNAAGSYKVTSGATFSIQTNRAVSVIGGTTGQAWTATET